MSTCQTASTALVFLLTMSLSTAAENKPNDTVSEQLQGRWEIVAGKNQGRQMSESEVEGTYVTISTNTITIYDRDERQRYQAIFRIDESKIPMHITMTSVPKNAPKNQLKTADRAENSVASGILKLDGQTRWQLCYALPGTDRPEKFESPPGREVLLFTLEKKQGDLPPDLSKRDSVE